MGRRRSNRSRQLSAKALSAYRTNKPRICPTCSNTLVVYNKGGLNGFRRVVCDLCQVYKDYPKEIKYLESDAVLAFIVERQAETRGGRREQALYASRVAKKAR